MYKLFYLPEKGYCGDFIPFWDKGRFHIFYLKDFRDHQNYGEGTPWYHLSTTDFINYKEHGEAIARGTKEEQDLYIFTGSVIYAKDKYHIFYTGHNHHLGAKNKPIQAVMHAVSEDMEKWEKVPSDTFYANPEKYEVNDFRDPFVFYNEELDLYSMLLVSRKKDCGYTAGFTAHYTSPDLVNWTDNGEFWSPNLYHTHECPDLFKMGEWWYLIFSEYSDRRITRYVMSKSMTGPWVMPPDDTFDGKAYYAAKTTTDGNKRYIFGWNATKSDNNDNGGWMWGGNLGVHEVIQREDGTLGCKIPETIKNYGTLEKELEYPINLSKADGKAEAVLFENTGEAFRIDAELEFEGGTSQFGITFASSFKTKHGYKYEFYPKKNRFEFCGVTSPINTVDVAHLIDLQKCGKIKISLIVEGTICILYVNDDLALSSRFYNRAGNDVSVFATCGSIKINSASYYNLEENKK